MIMSPVLKTIPAMRSKPILLRVAAYARVSTAHEHQHSSIAVQVSHYSRLIQSTPGWEYVGVFIDEGITGTSTKNRDGFNDLMATARRGDIDIILTKSISRFARNTLDLLKAIRELKSLSVTVRFERENIDTATTDGELLLTLLASFAQEESRSNSKNVKWAIRKKYENGELHSRHPYGYRYIEGQLHIIEHEAAVVRRLFNAFLQGIPPEVTAEQLNAEGLKPRRGKKFHGQALRKWLENETYAGNAMLQKHYRPKVADTNSQRNHGELPRYLVKNSHPAIIDQSTFDAVQQELARRRQLGFGASPTSGGNALTSHIICSVCGQPYYRRTRKRSKTITKYWWCSTATKGKGNPCRAPQIQEHTLKEICLGLLNLDQWNDTMMLEVLHEIIANPERTLTIYLKDNSEPVKVNLNDWKAN